MVLSPPQFKLIPDPSKSRQPNECGKNVNRANKDNINFRKT